METLPFKDISGEVIKLQDIVVFSRYNRDSSIYVGVVSKISLNTVTVNGFIPWYVTRISKNPSQELLIVNNNKRLLDKAKSLGLLSNKS